VTKEDGMGMKRSTHGSVEKPLPTSASKT